MRNATRSCLIVAFSFFEFLTEQHYLLLEESFELSSKVHPHDTQKAFGRYLNFILFH